MGIDSKGMDGGSTGKRERGMAMTMGISTHVYWDSGYVGVDGKIVEVQ